MELGEDILAFSEKVLVLLRIGLVNKRLLSCVAFKSKRCRRSIHASELTINTSRRIVLECQRFSTGPPRDTSISNFSPASILHEVIVSVALLLGRASTRIRTEQSQGRLRITVYVTRPGLIRRSQFRLHRIREVVLNLYENTWSRAGLCT